MPIYEYACEHCGHHLEVMQKISEDPLTLCPMCQKHSLQRLVSAAAFRLKGGGWYETDFKDADKKKNLASNDSDSGSDTKADAKSDSTKEAAGNPASKDAKDSKASTSGQEGKTKSEGSTGTTTGGNTHQPPSTPSHSNSSKGKDS